MNAGTLRRVGSFVVDFVLVIAVVFLVYRFAAMPIISSQTGHDALIQNIEERAVSEIEEDIRRLEDGIEEKEALLKEKEDRIEEDEDYTQSDYEEDAYDINNTISQYESDIDDLEDDLSETKQQIEEGEYDHLAYVSYLAGEMTAIQEDLETRLEEDPTYTQEDFDEDMEELNALYEEYDSYVEFIVVSIIFHYVAWVVINYVYQGLMKGRTFGRRWSDVELHGRVNWGTLFMREVLWKGVFWAVTLTLGAWIDFLLISFTKDKKTIRDRVSGNRVILTDVPYPI